MLGQQFPQLPQLKQGRIGIVGEIALRQRAQPEQLFVVGAEVGALAHPLTDAGSWVILAAPPTESRATAKRSVTGPRWPAQPA